MVSDIKSGDIIIRNDKSAEVISKDRDGDIWIIADSSIDHVEVIGYILIENIKNQTNEYFDEEYKDILEPDVQYTYISCRTNVFTKLSLTKLLKKMYNIKDDYTGNIYSIRRGIWRR